MRRAATAFAVGFLTCRLLAAQDTFVRSRSDGSQTEIGTNSVVGASARSVHFHLVQMDMDRAASLIEKGRAPCDSFAVAKRVCANRDRSQPDAIQPGKVYSRS